MSSDNGHPERPAPLTVEPDPLPEKLRERDQWVCWRYAWRNGEWTKLPIDPNTGDTAKSTDSETWAPFTDAWAFHEEGDGDTDGVGFVVHDGDVIVGLDLDDCRNPETGEVDEWARGVVEGAPTYAEVSPSGTGLRLFGVGFKPDGKTRADVDGAEGHIEIYDTGRYLTVTGHQLDAAPGEVRQVNEQVSQIHAEYVEREKPTTDGGVQAGSGGSNPTPGGGKTGSHELPDGELLEKAKNAENGDKFTRLWGGDTSGYPSHSEADLALCGHLAFWTGGDRDRIDRLFRQSGLCREKWENRDDYRDRTINKALEGRSEFYEPAPDKPSSPATPEGAGSATGLSWGDVISSFESDANGTTTKAYDKAVTLLTEEYDFVTIRETGELYFYDEDRGFYVRKGETFLQERLKDHIPGHMNNNRWRNIRDLAKADTYISIDGFTPPTGKVCVQNGVLDLESRELVEHTPDLYFTSAIQTRYDPDAEAELWPQFLSDSVEKETEVKKLEEFIGYCLEAWHHNREKNLFVVGPRQSGKSTFLHLLQALFGNPPTVTNLTPQQLADTRFDASSLKEAMLNAVNDINATKIQDSGTLKRIFSGERLKLERKHQDAHFGAPKAKHAFTANWLPAVVGQDESLYRRILIVEFPNKIDDSDRDEELKAKLAGGVGDGGTEHEGELPGILNRALDARDRLHENEGFTNDRGDTATRRKWDSWRDAHKRFLYQQFNITGDGDDTVDKATYYRAYKEFAGREGYGLNPQQGVTKSLKWVPEIGVHEDKYSGLEWEEADATETTEQAGLRDVQEKRVSKVLGWVGSFTTPNQAAERGAVLDHAEEQGFDRDSVNHTIEDLLAKGELMEPQTGRLRRT